jgi:hypothetical protein
MDYSFTLVTGIGIVIFGLLYFAFKLAEVHIFWKTLTAFFVFSLMILIPKALIDSGTTCQYYPANQTTYMNTTFISYSQLCVTESHTTDTVFLKLTLWLFRLFCVYILIYLNWEWWIAKRLYAVGIIKKKDGTKK